SKAIISTKDQGANFFTEDLTNSKITSPSSVAFINDNNGVQALLVGGLKSTAKGPSPIAVADSDTDGKLSDWRPFGRGLPNVLATALSYNPLADVLAVGAVGRGVWALFDVTSYFRQATTLQFGLADNNSKPSARHLVDGTSSTGTFVRALNKYGTGILTIAGKATYTGGTTIWDGALQLGKGGKSGSIRGDVSFCDTGASCNAGTDKFLAFNRTDTYTFGGVISGPGQVLQNGVGTTVLNGVSTYTGPTWVNRGTLRVNGSIVSPVVVNNGGTLGGSGSVGATTLGFGGMFAPGNSIGTTTVNGNLTLGPGASYEAEVNAKGQSDKIVVNGTVNLTGATLRVLATAGGYRRKTKYVIIDNDGNDAINGRFADASTNSIFLASSLNYKAGASGNNVVLTITHLPFSSAARTRNQTAVADALDNGAFGPLAAAIFFQTPQGARQAFDALSGEIHATVAGTLADDSRYVREAILGRLMQAGYSNAAGQPAALGASGPDVASLDDQAMALGYDDKSLSVAPPHSSVAFWTRAYGAWADFSGDGNAATADRDLGGFVSGMDASIGGSWRIGLATGASFSNVKVEARNSSADVDSFDLAGYLGGMAGGFALRGGGAWSWSNIDTSRAVIFPGFFERQNASYDADTGQLFGEIAYPTQMGRVALEPFAGLAYVSIDTDRFKEHGGALASLRGSADEDVGYSTLGVRAASMAYWDTMQVVPHISLAWQHAFSDVTPDAALAFVSTGTGFTVYGVPVAEDSALIDAGVDFALGPNTTAGVSYSGQFGDGVSDNGVKGRLTWLF
ncbi:MAG: autotransporter domain-containing protein, partial [Hyphomicrobiales bacterium]